MAPKTTAGVTINADNTIVKATHLLMVLMATSSFGSAVKSLNACHKMLETNELIAYKFFTGSVDIYAKKCRDASHK
jgi:hypothetical protein